MTKIKAMFVALATLATVAGSLATSANAENRHHMMPSRQMHHRNMMMHRHMMRHHMQRHHMMHSKMM